MWYFVVAQLSGDDVLKATDNSQLWDPKKVINYVLYYHELI